MKSFYNNSRKWPKRKKKTYLQIKNKDIATMIFKKQSISFGHQRKKNTYLQILKKVTKHHINSTVEHHFSCTELSIQKQNGF